MDAKQMKGLAVVTIAEADRLGRVEEVLFRSQPLQVAALRISTDDGSRIVGMNTITNVGTDAITTDTDASAAEGESDLRHEDLRGLDDLGKSKVVDRDGSYLGQVTRVELDPSTGDVQSLDVRKGHLLGWGGETMTIARDDIVAVGQDLITVNGTGLS